jgi:hypothetical protein
MIDLLLAARGDRRRQAHHAGGRARRGSLMRHVLAPAPITGLPDGVVHPAAPAPLIAVPCGVERRAPGSLGAGTGAVAIAPIADAAEEEHLLTVGAGTAHEPERVHRSLRAIHKGVDTDAAVCELWVLGQAESRCRGLARGSGGVAPSGPSPSRRPGRNQAYPTSAGRGNQPRSVLTVSSSEFRTFRSSTTICAEPGRPAARPVTMTSWKADCASGIGPTARSRQRGGTGSDMICKQTPRKAALQTRGHRAHVSRAPAPAFSRLASSTDLQLGVRGTLGGARLGQEEFMNFAVPL